MKPLKLLVLGIACAACNAVAADSSLQLRAPTHPAMYSFVDVFRLTVGGAIGGAAGIDSVPEAPIRVASPQAPALAEPRFAISAVRQPDKWLLVLAGLALAGWVAHRRLVHSL